jgi:hypothetical protein
MVTVVVADFVARATRCLSCYLLGKAWTMLTQNLKALLQDIGEDSAILQLSMRMSNAKKRGWKVYRSYTEDSCDLVIRRVHGKPPRGYRKELRIEVKARQNVIKKRKGDQIQFLLSKAEYNSCHFLVGYWFDRGDYFIVPRAALKPATKKKKHYRFIANVLKDGKHNEVSSKYLERWDRILTLIK